MCDVLTCRRGGIKRRADVGDPDNAPGNTRTASCHGDFPGRPTVAQAIEQLRLQLVESDHRFWQDDISIADDGWFDRGRILGPNQITDAYLLALAVKNGGRLVTFDRGIPLATVRGAEPRHLVMI